MEKIEALLQKIDEDKKRTRQVLEIFSSNKDEKTTGENKVRPWIVYYGCSN